MIKTQRFIKFKRRIELKKLNNLFNNKTKFNFIQKIIKLKLKGLEGTRTLDLMFRNHEL